MRSLHLREHILRNGYKSLVSKILKMSYVFDENEGN